MSINIKLVSDAQLMKHVQLQADLLLEVIRRLAIVEDIQNQLDDAENKIDDLELGIQDSIDKMKELI